MKLIALRINTRYCKSKVRLRAKSKFSPSGMLANTTVQLAATPVNISGDRMCACGIVCVLCCDPLRAQVDADGAWDLEAAMIQDKTTRSHELCWCVRVCVSVCMCVCGVGGCDGTHLTRTSKLDTD